MSAALPVADADQVRRYARTLVRRHPRGLAVALGLHALAAAAHHPHGPAARDELTRNGTTQRAGSKDDIAID